MSDARYQRQQQVPALGAQSQQKLAAAHVLVVGAGGLGSPVSYIWQVQGLEKSASLTVMSLVNRIYIDRFYFKKKMSVHQRQKSRKNDLVLLTVRSR